MGARRHDPLRLDVAALAAEGTSLSGEWPAAELERWRAMQTLPAQAAPQSVQWQVRGELRRGSGQPPQPWLHLWVQTSAGLTCQRCLQPFMLPLAVDRAVRFAGDERQAEALDADSDDDVLALAPTLDLRALVEDELLLACPIVPRHEACDLPAHGAETGVADGASPFGALAALKPAPRSN